MRRLSGAELGTDTVHNDTRTDTLSDRQEGNGPGSTGGRAHPSSSVPAPWTAPTTFPGGGRGLTVETRRRSGGNRDEKGSHPPSSAEQPRTRC